MFTPQEAQDFAELFARKALTIVDELELMRVGTPNAVGRTITRKDLVQLSQKIAQGVLEALTPQTFRPQE